MLYFRMNTLQDRITTAFTHAKQKDKSVSKTALANAAKVSRQAVSHWFTGATKSLDASTLLRVASFLNVRAEWLDGQGGGMVVSSDSILSNVSEVSLATSSVPLISWEKLGEWANDSHTIIENDEGYQTVMSIFDTGRNGYALRVEGDSMAPSYRQGEIIYINPDKEAKHGMRVIAKTEFGTTFKELVIEDGVKRLKALNPNWSPQYMQYNEDTCKILGVVVGTVRLENH